MDQDNVNFDKVLICEVHGSGCTVATGWSENGGSEATSRQKKRKTGPMKTEGKPVCE